MKTKPFYVVGNVVVGKVVGFSVFIITSDKTAKGKRIKTVIQFMFVRREPIKTNDQY